MPKPLIRESHIDALEPSKYLPELLDIKGPYSAPNLIDLEKASCVVDLTQGGFGKEAYFVQHENNQNINGVAAAAYTTAVDVSSAAQPQQRYARVHSLNIELVLDQAGAAALTPAGNERYVRLYIRLRNSAGTILNEIVRTEIQLSTYRGYYSWNPLIEWNGYVPTGYSLQYGIALPADFSAVPGAAVFPANSVLWYSITGTIKNKGGQLPI